MRLPFIEIISSTWRRPTELEKRHSQVKRPTTKTFAHLLRGLLEIPSDYIIATDPRFKGATSGAGTAFTVAFYGTDQYIIQYDYEIGPPWNPKAWETYQKISYPFLHADRIKTPTLFLGGERDFNVPVQGGQQMYQALRSLGVDTQLIIYPNENHGITRPSYIRDRYERYLAWYDKYVKKNAAPVKNVAEASER